MKVAIVGAGYAGLATAYFLSQNNVNVTVFEDEPGASHASTGLLHPSPGRKAAPTWKSDEGMKATVELLEIASQKRPVFLRNGIMRIATTDEQRKDFGGEKVWIPEGITVFSRLYLEGLKQACKNVQFVQQKIQNLSELKSYDARVVATGAQTGEFFDLPLKKTIGQCLICRWEERVPMSLLSHGHITPTEDPDFCSIGSTYEHTAEPDPKKALELLDKCALFYPPAKNFKVVEIRSGVRIAPKIGYRPLVQEMTPKTWVFTGLGSRGLIYHAMLSKSLVMNDILNL
jgi:glycine/D-amino acid oxidase-like deaminating enzyme